jgi:uncharacterized protein YndB with AHSA1/START domain
VTFSLPTSCPSHRPRRTADRCIRHKRLPRQRIGWRHAPFRSGWFLAMSTYILQHQLKPPRIPAGSGRIPDGGWDLAISSIANADRSRILRALTVPEYMEAWLCLPGDTMPSVSASRTANGYRIQRFGPHGVEIDISGTYRTFRQAKLLFTWQRNAEETKPTSLVLIRLYGEFARTRLCLHHVGLGSAEERDWHLEMWKGSLDRLRALFR